MKNKIHNILFLLMMKSPEITTWNPNKIQFFEINCIFFSWCLLLVVLFRTNKHNGKKKWIKKILNIQWWGWHMIKYHCTIHCVTSQTNRKYSYTFVPVYTSSHSKNFRRNNFRFLNSNKIRLQKCFPLFLSVFYFFLVFLLNKTTVFVYLFFFF